MEHREKPDLDGFARGDSVYYEHPGNRVHLEKRKVGKKRKRRNTKENDLGASSITTISEFSITLFFF